MTQIQPPSSRVLDQQGRLDGHFLTTRPGGLASIKSTVESHVTNSNA